MSPSPSHTNPTKDGPVTEAATIADLTRAALTPTPFTAEPGRTGVLVHAEGTSLHHYDYEHLLDAPRRARGTVHVHDAQSLVTYVRKHATDNPPPVDANHDRALAVRALRPNTETHRHALYADVDTPAVTAVLNGHGPDSEPGWGDHRAVLTLRWAPEWCHWADKDRQWLDQTEFAEHLEEGMGEIREPTAGDMMEIAQTMQANTTVQWRSQRFLGNGQVQFTYHETVDARAGSDGTLEIPQRFTLGLIVFDGQTEGYRLDARFQFRRPDGRLKVRYLLTRPHDVVSAAFGDVVTVVEDGTGLAALRGQAPS